MRRLDPATAVVATAEGLQVTIVWLSVIAVSKTKLRTVPTPRVNVEMVATVSAKAVTNYARPRFEAALQPARSVLTETKFSVTRHTGPGLPPQQIKITVCKLNLPQLIRHVC